MAQNRTAKNQVNFRVDDKEYAILKAKAEVAGLSPSMFAKQQALNGRVKAPVITKDIGQLILPEISKIGSNVNQIARKLNQGGSPMLSEFKEIQAEFETLWAYVLDGKKPKPRSKSEEEKLEQETGQTRLEESPETCPVCGSVAVRKHSNKHNQDFWICPNYSKEEKGHLFKWVE